MVQLALLVTLGQDVLLDGFLADQTVDVHFTRLTNTVTPVLGLRQIILISKHKTMCFTNMFYEPVVQICFTHIVSAHAWVDEGNNRIQSADTMQVYLSTCHASA